MRRSTRAKREGRNRVVIGVRETDADLATRRGVVPARESVVRLRA